jgi:hypothetical protein
VYAIRLDPSEIQLIHDRYRFQPAGTVATNLLEIFGPKQVGQ